MDKVFISELPENSRWAATLLNDLRYINNDLLSYYEWHVLLKQCSDIYEKWVSFTLIEEELFPYIFGETPH